MRWHIPHCHISSLFPQCISLKFEGEGSKVIRSTSVSMVWWDHLLANTCKYMQLYSVCMCHQDIWHDIWIDMICSSNPARVVAQRSIFWKVQHLSLAWMVLHVSTWGPGKYKVSMTPPYMLVKIHATDCNGTNKQTDTQTHKQTCYKSPLICVDIDI